MLELYRIFFLTFNIVLLYKYPILQSLLNLMVLLIYDYNLIRYSKRTQSFFFLYNFILGPNKIWYINIFLIVIECSLTLIFSTPVIFAYLDKIGFFFL